MEEVKNERYTISWDITDTEWVVQFWKINKDNTTKTLFMQLDKNFNYKGGFVELPSKDFLNNLSIGEVNKIC